MQTITISLMDYSHDKSKRRKQYFFKKRKNVFFFFYQFKDESPSSSRFCTHAYIGNGYPSCKGFGRCRTIAKPNITKTRIYGIRLALDIIPAKALDLPSYVSLLYKVIYAKNHLFASHPKTKGKHH